MKLDAEAVRWGSSLRVVKANPDKPRSPCDLYCSLLAVARAGFADTNRSASSRQPWSSRAAPCHEVRATPRGACPYRRWTGALEARGHHQRRDTRVGIDFRELDAPAFPREARLGPAPTSCCSSANDTRSLFNTSAPAGVIRYTRASRDRLGSVARSHPRRAIRASNGYNVPGLNR